jgi:hypothetical protein
MHSKSDFHLETFGDPGWNLTVSNQQTYSEGGDLNDLIQKVDINLPLDLKSIDLAVIRNWYLVVATNEEWFHKDTFYLTKIGSSYKAMVNIDYIFDDYEIDFDLALNGIKSFVDSLHLKSQMTMNGELEIHFESSSIVDMISNINSLLTKYPARKIQLTLEKNWDLFLNRLSLVIEPVNLPQQFRIPSEANLFQLLEFSIDNLQHRAGKERFLITFSSFQTKMRLYPQLNSEINEVLGDLNRYLNLELLDWSKFD